MKTCFKCGAQKELGEFYKHPKMADGRVNKCKECNKKDSTDNRWKNIEKIRAYDRARGNRQDFAYMEEYRKKYPAKARARSMVNNAVKGKKMLKPDACSICGVVGRIYGHHDDYAYPLTVRWLCQAHHRQWHRDNGEGLNG